MASGKFRKGRALTVLDESVLGSNVKLSREEQTRVRDVFNEYDTDGSGQIDKSEVGELLGDLKWGVDQDQLQSFMTNVFGDNVRVFNFETFMKLYKAVLAKQPLGVRKQQSLQDGYRPRAGGRINIDDLRLHESDLRRLFMAKDEDKTGYLSIAEMRNVILMSGLPDLDGDNFETLVHEHMCIADKNKDGKVSFEEFISYRNAMIDYCYGQVVIAEDAGPEEDPGAYKGFRFVD